MHFYICTRDFSLLESIVLVDQIWEKCFPVLKMCRICRNKDVHFRSKIYQHLNAVQVRKVLGTNRHNESS